METKRRKNKIICVRSRRKPVPGLMGGIVHERLATKCSQLHLVADCVNFAPYILDHNSAVKRPAVNNSFFALRLACFVQKRRPGSCQVFIDINIRHCFSQLLSGAHHGHLTCITFKLNNDRSRACLRLVGIAPLSNTVGDVHVCQGQRGQVGVELAKNCFNNF